MLSKKFDHHDYIYFIWYFIVIYLLYAYVQYIIKSSKDYLFIYYTNIFYFLFILNVIK